MLQLPVYLDNNATTPCDPRVLETMLPFFTENFGNAASKTHSFGWVAEEAVEHAREQLARSINADPKEIVFTSGATESNNLALKGAFEMYASKGNHIITAATEHKAVLDTCKHLEKLGAEITYLGVKNDGRIDIGQLDSAIKPSTILIAIMYANNEIGTIQPVREIASVAKERGILFFCDAAQAAGKIPVDVMRDGIDLLAFTAHKMYGPKGVGALYVRRRDPRARVTQQMDGGGHERGMRSGTLNVPAIVGFGKASELAIDEMHEDATRLGALRNKLESALLELGEVSVNGSREHRLPHTTNLSFQNVSAERLMMSFNKNIAVSSGSACTSALVEPSYVLKALGLPDDLARSSLRFGLGRFTTEEQIDYTIEEVSKNLQRLREMKHTIK